MLDYKQLEALAAVVEEGGFERAGQKLHISQSAVTQRIRQLEELTGQILLVRSQPPDVTGPGSVLLEHFRKVKLLEQELAEKNEQNCENPVIPLAINADSLVTWFADVMALYLKEGTGLLDIVSADQDVTHKLLAEGKVMGCVSASASPVRACQTVFLGEMVYRFVCTEEYKRRFFPEGVDLESLNRAPKLNFNRDDQLINNWAENLFPGAKGFANSHFAPSSKLFLPLIGRGDVCGMVPDEQFSSYRGGKRLVDLSLGQPVMVPLYWHRWSIESVELDYLSRLIIRTAGEELQNTKS